MRVVHVRHERVVVGVVADIGAFRTFDITVKKYVTTGVIVGGTRAPIKHNRKHCSVRYCVCDNAHMHVNNIDTSVQQMHVSTVLVVHVHNERTYALSVRVMQCIAYAINNCYVFSCDVKRSTS